MADRDSVLREVLEKKRTSLMVKRMFDVVTSVLGLVLTSPVLAIIAAVIYLEDGRPILFRKACVGPGGRRFYALKFRTMDLLTDPAEEPLHIARDHPNIRRVGRILRKTALDELPQLWNIMRGDMSFVGPRAWRWEYVRRIESELADFALTRVIRPGLTGLAQVYGTYFISPRRKMRYDILYIKKLSLLLDLKLIAVSFVIALKADWQNSRKRWRRAKRRFADIRGW